MQIETKRVCSDKTPPKSAECSSFKSAVKKLKWNGVRLSLALRRATEANDRTKEHDC
jgi:hypothetical protein